MKTWHKGWTREKWIEYRDRANRINLSILRRGIIEPAIQEAESRED